MMVAGTYVLTDTIDQLFDEIFNESNEGTDAVDHAEGGDRDRGRLDAAVPGVDPRRRCAATEGVDEAAGGDLRPAGRDHRQRRRARSAATARRLRRLDRPRALRPARPTSRAARPRRDDEVAIDKATADDEGFELGDPLDGRRQRGAAQVLPLVGITSSATSTRSAARRSPLFTLPEAQRITGKEGEFDQIRSPPSRGHRRPERLAAQR